ncbi:coiled-coil domain-containing protein 39-like, partial [Sinocyclocheilus grahami]|uniref:coiled-coil domain-containing protein 39-like n=1 Tax=Sinocyclocheilus grahami TaxID=75366 RepID=UPI0007ACB87F
MQAEMNQVIREKNYLLKERKDFMDREIENNKELERNISAAERQALRLRQQHQEEERSQRRLQDEVEVLKGTLDRTATDVETTRSQLTSMKKDIQDKTEIDAQLLWQRELMFRKSKELQGLRDKEKNTTAEICATRAAISNLDSRLSKQDQNLLKQQMIISNQDFQIQMLERKTLHLQGKVNTEEKEALEKKASDLAEALEEKKRTAVTLTTQLKKLQDSMVEKGLLKMEVQRLRDLLYDRADGVLSLEKRRLQLQVAMKEREEEIHVHREMLAKQAKLTEQERQGL